MGNMSKFWVVGGEYKDTEFSELIDGATQLVGPFRSYEQAHQVWRRKAEATRGNAYVRYSIAREG